MVDQKTMSLRWVLGSIVSRRKPGGRAKPQEGQKPESHQQDSGHPQSYGTQIMQPLADG